MSRWRRDTRESTVRQIGDYRVYSETNHDRETAHVIEFPDHTEIRVLPDGRSGQQRSRLVRKAVDYLDSVSERLVSPDAALVVFRGLADTYSLEWEEVVECVHAQLEGVGGLDRRDGGLAYATVVCPECGEKWWGLVEPLGKDDG